MPCVNAVSAQEANPATKPVPRNDWMVQHEGFNARDGDDDPAARGFLSPRAEKTDHPLRVKIAEINAIIAKLDDGKRVFFQDIGPKFRQPDGTLTKDIMPDLLHLIHRRYRIWDDAIQEKLAELLK